MTNQILRGSTKSPPPDTPGSEVEQRVARILASAGEISLPREVREVTLIQAATLAIIEADLGIGDEVELLLRLLQTARAAQLPQVAIEAILNMTRVDRPLPEDRDFEFGAARRLHSLGYAGCPTCLRPLPSEAEMKDYRTRRDALLAEGARRRDLRSRFHRDDPDG